MTAFALDPSYHTYLRDLFKPRIEAEQAAKEIHRARSLQERVLDAVRAVNAPQVASVTGKPAMLIQFCISITEGSDWCKVERVKPGARQQKKPRRMHRSRLDSYLASLNRNDYAIDFPEWTGSVRLYAIATQRI